MTAEIDGIRRRLEWRRHRISELSCVEKLRGACVDVDTLLTEIDRLTAERKDVAQWADDELRAQNTTLRSALKFYANGEWNDGYPGGIVYQRDGHTVLDMGAIAKAALKVKKASEETTKGHPYYWCPNCKVEVDWIRVTFEEMHDACGYAVEVRGGTA